jgi:hypothetical protein
MTTTTITVTNEALLNAAIGTVDAATSGTFQIDFNVSRLSLGTDLGNTFTLNGTTESDPVDLFALNLHSGVALTINGEGDILDGGSNNRGLLAYAGNVIIENLTIQNATAQGGNGGGGGGGGAGLGGGLFVAQGATVTLENVRFNDDDANGGSGSSGNDGGGGGLGGSGGLGASAGGGGVGARATGSGGHTAGQPGVIFGAASGGSGGNGNGGTSYAGGTWGGGGAGGGTPSAGKTANEGGGGGVGGVSGNSGGTGGFGGGGAASVNGGFGGGGGGGVETTGATGGFGGGGGSGSSNGGAGGFGAGAGTSSASGTAGGGGGLGAGGDVFVQQGGDLILNSGTLSAGVTHGGPKGASGAGDGLGLGSDLFIQGSNIITLAAPAASSLTIAGQVTDTAANGGTGAGTLLINGAGTVILAGTVNIGGGVTLASGTFETENGSSFTDSGGIVFDGTATLDVAQTANNQAFTTQIQYLMPGDVIDLAGVTPANVGVSATSIQYKMANGTTGTIAVSTVPFTGFQVTTDNNGGSLITGIIASGTTVNTEAQLNAAIAAADAETSGSFTISLGGTITEGTDAGDFSRYGTAFVADPLDLFGINLQPGVTLNFGSAQFAGGAIDGASLYRGLFVYAGNVTLQRLKIENTVAEGGAGGDGGGGGAGLGGALFVAGTNAGLSSGGTVTLGSYVTFTDNSAVGGAGGNYGFYDDGGGGGLGGPGGASGTDNGAGRAGGGGGIGSGATGGKYYAVPGKTGIILGLSGAAGGVDGGGGNGSPGGHTYAKGGGAGGGTGAAGGFGGGGAGANGGGGNDGVYGDNGGTGGFGGGGGGTGAEFGGSGGFGGGAGATSSGGFGGGNEHGPNAIGVGGGGGLGAGGNIFVQQGGSLIIGPRNMLNGGTVIGGIGSTAAVIGTGGGTFSPNGSAYGSGIFLQGNETIGVEVDPPLFTTIAGDVTDAQSGSSALILEGNREFLGGGVEFDSTVNLGGGVTIEVGEVLLDGSITPRTGVIFDGYGTLEINSGGANPFSSPVTGFNDGDEIVIDNASTITNTNGTVSYTVGSLTSSFSLATEFAGQQIAIEGDTITALPVTLTVGTEAQLQSAIAEVDEAVSGNFLINFSANITEASDSGNTVVFQGTTIADPRDLFALNAQPGVGVTINGNGFELNGKGTITNGGYTYNRLFRGFFVLGGYNTTIENMTIANARAAGGYGLYGGGGGAGLGGGVFVAGTVAGVNNGATVTLNNVTFSGDSAAGGGGEGVDGNSYGAGGGLGGWAGDDATFESGSVGGGGIGFAAMGGSANGVFGGAGTGIVLGVPASSATAADGGGGLDNGGGGGLGGTGPANGIGGAGGFGGGGGSNGGAGGFGGGGGAIKNSSTYAHGAGGWGGGAGVGGTPGFGGGAANGGYGGGGLAAGGDIFVQQGGSLTINSGTLGAATLTGGLSDGSGTTGGALGSGIFLQGTQHPSFNPASGTTLTVAGNITDDGPQNGGTGAASMFVGGSGGTMVVDGGIVVGGFIDLQGIDLQIGDPSQGSAMLASASLSAQAIGFFTDAASLLDIESTAAGTPFTSAIDEIGIGDVIHLAGVDPATASYNSSTGEVTYDIGTTPESFPLALFPGQILSITGDDGGTDIGIACYLRGTRILTAHGEVPVEDLRAGDPVVTRPGMPRPIRWIGHRTIDLSRHPSPELAQPIRISANAIAEGVPARDLWVSPDHAIFLNGVLIAARQLCNGATITRETRFRSVQYFHIELHTHSIIMAEGLPSESYLDTGNRGMFENAEGPLLLHPAFAPGHGQAGREAASCFPLVSDAERVEPVWCGLVNRARTLGHSVYEPETTDDPMLRVVVAGRVLAPAAVENDCHRFVLPRSDGTVRLVSRACRPCDIRPWIEDRRRLGVYVSRVVWHDDAGPHEMPVNHPAAGDGWWDVERDGGRPHRWTDGDAQLALSPRATVLEVHVAGGMVWPVAATRPANDMAEASHASPASRLRLRS